MFKRMGLFVLGLLLMAHEAMAQVFAQHAAAAPALRAAWRRFAAQLVSQREAYWTPDSAEVAFNDTTLGSGGAAAPIGRLLGTLLLPGRLPRLRLGLGGAGWPLRHRRVRKTESRRPGQGGGQMDRGQFRERGRFPGHRPA